MKHVLTEILTKAVGVLGVTDVVPVVDTTTDGKYGDYATGVAMQLAGRLKRKPIEIATELKKLIITAKVPYEADKPDHSTAQKGQKLSLTEEEISVLRDVGHVDVVPPGYLNVHFSEAKRISNLVRVLNTDQAVGTIHSETEKSGKTPKKVMVEFAHPNTHKAFHIGHLRNITTGESIVRLLEATGNRVVRVNYQGDVGMHIAKCLWGIQHNEEMHKQEMQNVENEEMKNGQSIPNGIRSLPLSQRVEWLGKMYAAGSKAYEEDDKAKTEIGQINKAIYAKGGEAYDLYRETRQWSLDYFETIYKRVGTRYDRYYFESEVYESGKENVLKGLEKGIFQESDGAVIFPGEKHGLHNRVFITGEGNPTYEGKEMGLGPLQFGEHQPDLIIHVVGPEQAGYFQVCFEALAQLFPETRGKEYHLIYGWVKLKHGKMSSRSGNVVLGEWLLDEAKKEVRKIFSGAHRTAEGADPEEIAEKAAVAAVKYAFLKVSTLNEIAFDFAESVNLNGDSGPYLQYTYARCRSVLRKSGMDAEIVDKLGKALRELSTGSESVKLNNEEQLILRHLLYFADIVREAAEKRAPNVLCGYLYHLAQYFNLFYSKHSILESDRVGKSADNEKNEAPGDKTVRESAIKTLRIAITAGVSTVISRGLYLLGIENLEKM